MPKQNANCEPALNIRQAFVMFAKILGVCEAEGGGWSPQYM